MSKHSKRIPVPEDDHTTDEGQVGLRRRKRALAFVFIGILVVCFIVSLAIGLTFTGKDRSLNLKRRSGLLTLSFQNNTQPSHTFPTYILL